MPISSLQSGCSPSALLPIDEDLITLSVDSRRPAYQSFCSHTSSSNETNLEFKAQFHASTTNSHMSPSGQHSTSLSTNQALALMHAVSDTAAVNRSSNRIQPPNLPPSNLQSTSFPGSQSPKINLPTCHSSVACDLHEIHCPSCILHSCK